MKSSYLGRFYDEVEYDGNDEADDVKEYTVCNNRVEDTVTGGWVMLEYPGGRSDFYFRN
jgi:hypothetical protein